MGSLNDNFRSRNEDFQSLNDDFSSRNEDSQSRNDDFRSRNCDFVSLNVVLRPSTAAHGHCLAPLVHYSREKAERRGRSKFHALLLHQQKKVPKRFQVFFRNLEFPVSKFNLSRLCLCDLGEIIERYSFPDLLCVQGRHR